MAKWDISGSWTGTYWYDPNLAFTVLPSPVGFKLSVRQGWFGRFSGEILDNLLQGIAGDAAIKGRVSRSGVTFWKQYRIEHIWDDSGGLVTLREFLEEQSGVRLDETHTSEPIRYRGTYTESDGIVQGSWEIQTHYLQCWNGRWPVNVEIPGCTGEWQMTRQTQ